MASLEELLYFLFAGCHPFLETLYEMMKIEEKLGSAPTCSLSSAVVTFWLTSVFKEADILGGHNQLSSHDFRSLCSKLSLLLLFLGHFVLCRWSFPLSAKEKPLLAEPAELWKHVTAGSSSWHYLHLAHWNNIPVVGGVSVKLSIVSVHNQVCWFRLNFLHRS